MFLDFFFLRRTKCAIFQKSLNRTTSCRIGNFVWLIFSFHNKYELAVFLVIILEINAWSKMSIVCRKARIIFLELLWLHRLKFDCSESRLSHILHAYARTYIAHTLLSSLYSQFYIIFFHVQYNIVTIIKYRCPSPVIIRSFNAIVPTLQYFSLHIHFIWVIVMIQTKMQTRARTTAWDLQDWLSWILILLLCVC